MAYVNTRHGGAIVACGVYGWRLKTAKKQRNISANK